MTITGAALSAMTHSVSIAPAPKRRVIAESAA
jgi:hypothetical protein